MSRIITIQITDVEFSMILRALDLAKSDQFNDQVYPEYEELKNSLIENYTSE